MPIVRAQVSIGKLGGLPADTCMNTFHFLVDPVNPANLSSISAALEAFYSSIDQLMSASVDVNNVFVEYFNLSDPPPRVPVQRDQLAPLVVSGTALPDEVAITMSFHGAPISGEPQARRRGRVFLGPWGTSVSSIQGSHARVTQATIDTITDAGSALLLASQTSNVWSWGVYSPTDDQFVEAVGGWVDNAFDTIRSRGPEPTLREQFA